MRLALLAAALLPSTAFGEYGLSYLKWAYLMTFI